MNIKFLQRKPRFKTLAFTALASLAACSSTPDGENSDQATLDTSLDSGDGANGTGDGMLAPTGQIGEDGSAPGAETGADNANIAAAGGGQHADSRFGQRHAPEIKQAPFQAEGRWMNAFYIVRSPAESWETLSQLIYGRPDRADMLSKWNEEGTMKVGRVVYYNSAVRPEDNTSMKVLAQDFNIPMEQIKVDYGDTMSEIGQRLYGDVQTWQEIAALNPQIAQPDLIKPGQVLNIQPAQLNTSAILQQVLAQASTTPPADAQADQAAAAVASTAQPAQDQVAAPHGQDDNIPPGAVDTPQVTGPAGHTYSGLMTKIGLGLTALCLAGLLMRRWLNNKKSRDEWSAESDINVTKLSRPGN